MTQLQNNSITLSNLFGEQISREEALLLLQQDSETYQQFLTFPLEEQENVLSFIQGQHGLKITLDTFFNHVLSPTSHPDRLESLLSCLLNQHVHIKTVLPREGNKLAEAGSLVIMDIIVELADGSITDIEMQKIGYLFPGERSSCYVADFIMRQYNRIKSEKGKRFTYRDMKPVYLIVLMENSSKAFKSVAPHFIHREQSSYDSNADVTSLSNILYVSLDTFHEVSQNIDNKLQAWLTFLSSAEPKDILKLITKYPEFKEYYKDIVAFRKKPKELISMYSEALAILDHNTELYMINELQNTIKEKETVIAELDSTILEKNNTIAEKDNTIAEKDNTIAEKDNTIAEKDNTIAEKDNTIAEKDAIIAALQEKLHKLNIENN
ncbi:MAG: PD-(D/E)XK nuclease family transposase [Lachnospiraceae bacterium]|nr:PD-(D/E)XK nuclease family transposase [Lachnospiraceae bacterium]